MRRERIVVLAALVTAGIGALALATGLVKPVPLFGGLVVAASGIAAPPLDDPAMIRRGAAHFDRVCAQCHASPADPQRGDHLQFTPPAPVLHQRLGDRPPEALFLTVKHGVSGSAMPAWPTPFRDDEVWDVVAFLELLPDLDAERYRELAGAEEQETRPAMLATCARCHGTDGRGSPDGAFPRLDLQSPEYLFDALEAFAAGERASGFMQGVAAELTGEEMQALAEHYGQGAASDAVPTPGAHLFADVPPACTACHGPPDLARPQFPRIAGQYERYVRLQLELFIAGNRGGGPFSPLMHEAARTLIDE